MIHVRPFFTEDFAVSSSVLSSSDGFHISSLSETHDGKCLSKVVIDGHGIHKVIDYPCSDKPKTIINLNKTLLLGDEYFSDTHGELVRLKGESCIKEVFTEQDGSYSSTEHPLDETDCEKIKIKIGILKEQHDSWLEWFKNKQKEAQEQLMQLQNNLAALQQNIFGGFFGGLFG